jgi:hypothetical protein
LATTAAYPITSLGCSQGVHEGDDGELRWIVHEQMRRVVLAVEFHSLLLEVETHVGEDAAQIVL